MNLDQINVSITTTEKGGDTPDRAIDADHPRLHRHRLQRDSDPHNVQYLLSVLRESTGGGMEEQAGGTHDHAMGVGSSSSSTASSYSPTQQSEVSASARSADPRKRRPVAAEGGPGTEQRGAQASTSSMRISPSTDIARTSTGSTPLGPYSQSQPRSILKGSASPLPSAPPVAAAASPSSPPTEDLSHLSSTAPQTLPHLKRLASSALFLRALMTLKREQDELERGLQREWGRLEERHKSGATGVGAGAGGGKGGGGGGGGATTTALEREKERWKERALQRWDAVAEKQQVRLKELNTPGFYPTKSPAARANQRKILDLISGLIESG